MIRYLLHIGKLGGFVLFVVPALILACFYLLVQKGFPADVPDVWGLSVVGATLVLVVLERLGALVSRVRGAAGAPTPLPPQAPAWLKGAAAVAGSAVGAGVAGVAVLLVLLVVTVGTWPALSSDLPTRLGVLEASTRIQEEERKVTVSFSPEAAGLRSNIEGLEVGNAESLGAQVRTVHFSGPLAAPLAALGVQDAALPWTLLIARPQGPPSQVGALVIRDGYAERFLDAISALPGVAVSLESVELVPVQGGGAWSLQYGAAGPELLVSSQMPDPGGPGSLGDPGVDPMIPDEEPPPLHQDPFGGDWGETGDPSAPDVPRDPSSGPGGIDVAETPIDLDAPLPRELYSGDPFEGLD